MGGKNILPMKELTAILEKLGSEKVKTYIQSGNAVFMHNEKDTKRLADDIITAIKKSKGFKPHLLILTKTELEKAITSNPFPEAEAEPKTLHVFFMDSKPGKPNFDKMDDIKTDTEEYKLTGKFFYLYAPDGVGRSKLAAGAEKLLGVPATARNRRTVMKLYEMASDLHK